LDLKKEFVSFRTARPSGDGELSDSEEEATSALGAEATNDTRESTNHHSHNRGA